MTIIIELPGKPAMTATEAVAYLGEKEFQPCSIYEMLGGRVPRGTIRTMLYMARRKGRKIPRWVGTGLRGTVHGYVKKT